MDLNRSISNSYVLLVKTSNEYFNVVVLDLHRQETLFYFKFTHSSPLELDVHVTPITQVNPLCKLKDVKQHVVDAIKNLNSEHL